MKEHVKEDFELLLWSARIWGTIVAIIILSLLGSEFIDKMHSGESLFDYLAYLNKEGIIWGFLPFVIGSLGLIFALWKKGLGGGISLLSFIIGFSPIGFDAKELNGLIMTFIFFSLTSIPSILYLRYWWKMLQQNRKSLPPPMKKNAQVSML